MSASPSKPRVVKVPPCMNIRQALLTQPKAPDFVLPGLPVGSVGALVAPGATGKTMLLLQTSVALATGVPVLQDHIVGPWPATSAPQKVTLVVAEETLDMMHQRLHAVVAMLQGAQDLFGSSRSVLELLNENLRLVPLAGGPAMKLDECDAVSYDVESLDALAAGARLVVLDPLRQFHRGDENDSAAMTCVVQVLQRVATKARCAMVVAHHTNKWSGATGAGDKAAASRGSSALTDAVRWQMNLSELDHELAKARGLLLDSDSARQYVRLDLAKSNYLPPMSPLILRRGAGGVLTSPAQPVTKKGGGRGAKK